MSLTSERAREISSRPRIPPDVEEQAVALWIGGATDAEVQERFPTWSVGTFRNLRGRRKADIADGQRKRSIQFEDLFITRKQARLDDLQGQRNTASMLIGAHLATCFVLNPVTDEREFMEQLVDAKKLDIYFNMLDRALKMVMIETGQQLQMPKEYTRQALGLNGGEGIDHAKLAQRRREAAAEKQQREDADRKWRIEHAEEVAEDEVDRLLSRAKIRKQSPPSFQVFRNAAHEALEDIEDDEVHDRVDRWLEERFPGGVVGAELGDQDSDQAVTRPDVVDHGPVAAVVAAGVDESDGQGSEQEQDVDIIRLTPPRKPDEELDVEQVPGPAPEPEVDQFAELKSAFIQALGTGKAADDDELMRELKCGAGDFYAMLGQLTEDGVVVVEDGTGVRLSESCNAVA